MSKDLKLISLGVARKVHGLKGAAILLLENEQESVLKKGARVILEPLDEKSCLPPEGTEFTVTQIIFGHKVMLSLSGIERREELEPILPFRLSMRRSDFPALEADEYYLVDLVGSEVVDEAQGQLIGVVEKFYSNGVQTILVIKTPETLIEIPFVAAFIGQVDVANKRIQMRMPEFI